MSELILNSDNWLFGQEVQTDSLTELEAAEYR